MVAVSADGFRVHHFPEACLSSATMSLDEFRLEGTGMWENLTSVREGEVVRLEPLARRHERDLFEAAQDARIWRWMHYDASESREKFHAWLAPAYWQTGANVEAKLLMLEHAFEDLGCLRVEFKTDARNERSRAALAALPARFEGVFRKHMLVRGGESRDSAYYSVIDDEWPEVKDELGQRLDRIRNEEAV